MKRESFSSLRVPYYRWYFLGGAISMIGDNTEIVIRNWLVWQLTHSPFWLGFMVFCHWVPSTLLSIWAGSVADRVNNRKFIIFCQGLYAFSSILMGLLTITGLINIWQICLLLLIHGTAGALSQPSTQIFIHAMVGKENLLNAVSLNSSLRQATMIVGPAIGGWLLYYLGIGYAFLFNAVTFIPFVLVLWLVIKIDKVPSKAKKGSWQNLMEGLSYIKLNPLLIGLIGIVAIPSILIGSAFLSMMPIYADTIFKVGPKGYGFILTANGIGAILGGIALGLLSDIRRKGLTVAITALLYPVFVIIFVLSPSYLFALFVVLTIGFVQMITTSTVNTLVQINAPDEIRGRVMGVHSLGTSGFRIFNGLSLGVLATLLGAPPAMFISALMVGLITLGIIVKIPQLRQRIAYVKIG